ncbi:MAG TPA: EcsC family protein, partial [Beijerinckiaceae bacterium]
TTLILRAIADIARAEGEDLRDPEAALACLEVFALGGRTTADDHLDSGYFLVRGLLAQAVSEAAAHVARHGVAQEGAPALVRLIAAIAARFGVGVSQKAAAQAAPVFGAVGGAAINYAFAAHFQSLAHGHFTVRRLERTYGPATVRAAYDALAREQRTR